MTTLPYFYFKSAIVIQAARYFKLPAFVNKYLFYCHWLISLKPSRNDKAPAAVGEHMDSRPRIATREGYVVNVNYEIHVLIYFSETNIQRCFIISKTLLN